MDTICSSKKTYRYNKYTICSGLYQRGLMKICVKVYPFSTLSDTKLYLSYPLLKISLIQSTIETKLYYMQTIRI